MKYRKKPVTIEAIKWTGNNLSEIIAFGNTRIIVRDNNVLIIPTLEGDHEAQIGDMIIKGIKGELYPCKPDIFDATYDAVE